MTSLQNHEHRITTLETRVGEIESCHGETIYTMKRELRGVAITLRNVATNFDTPVATEADIDASLDQE